MPKCTANKIKQAHTATAVVVSHSDTDYRSTRQICVL